MDSKPAMEAIKARAFDARIPLYKLCKRARVSPARFTQHNNGEQVGIGTLGRLESAMAKIEQERKEQGEAVSWLLSMKL